LAWLRDKSWDPYAAGALLGLVVAFSEVICGRPLAASGAFDKLSVSLHGGHSRPVAEQRAALTRP
jgi:hypothetical protein